MKNYEIVARMEYVATAKIQARTKKEARELVELMDEGWFQEFDRFHIIKITEEK